MFAKKYILPILTILTILATNAWANSVDPLPKWDAKCHLPDGDSLLRFVSASDDTYEDDMRVELVTGKQRLILPVQSGLYYPRAIVGPTPGLCDRVGAFAVGKGMILFVLSLDARPSWNRATLVLLDSVRKNINDVRESIADIKDCSSRMSLVVKSSQQGVMLRLIEERIQDASSDGPETDIEGWIEVRAVHGKIFTRWIGR